MKMTRRAGLGAMAGLLATPGLLRAQTPTIRIVVPFGPGGSTDAVARLVSPGLQQRLGANVVVENRSGAAGSIGADIVAKARPDGQTWLLTFDSHATIPALLRNPPFDVLKDLDPVMLIGGSPYAVATRPDKPYRSIADVVAAAKARPGVTYGSTGNGTLGHLSMIRVGEKAGVQLTHVPYRSGGLAVNDAVAGHVEMMIGSAALLLPHITGGSLRPILQFGPQRLTRLAETQTAAEAGFPNMEAEAWWAVFAPHGTPADQVARMNTALKETLSEERARTVMTETQQARLVLSSPAELGTFFKGQVETWGGLVRAANIQPD
ncbi:Bug family tripartite tricarboxylate transporter substrate binding protein [Falsiroseomonas tokyonensis]|uniref:Bug family tripartite tricarboxylate transporter substrate binding protein n=1 Tax=Falsiroseomonas tokyonensis TaxID=430521 RepID=A0ABV7C0F2_9PROT|nr:tripartite tricarboxylate transporter substrate-binding protein [Falsiroseomonas tokyonensis]MBU8541269.1 tripartite tricarboxylate transporter substrate binding protein [Falsiroseomonas tokyonensis]